MLLRPALNRWIPRLAIIAFGLSLAIAPALAQTPDLASTASTASSTDLPPEDLSPEDLPTDRVWLVFPRLPSDLQVEAPALAEIPGVARPYCLDQGQFSLNACAVRWSDTAEFLRSQVYTGFALGLNDEMALEFAAVEALWSDFRNQHCGAMTSPSMGSSGYRMLYHNCIATVTNDRIADIQQWGTPAAPAIQSRYRLQAILRFFDITGMPSQRQWERYQTRHCRFEAQLFPDRPEQERQCYHRLTESRILQLQSWNALR